MNKKPLNLIRLFVITAFVVLTSCEKEPVITEGPKSQLSEKELIDNLLDARNRFQVPDNDGISSEGARIASKVKAGPVNNLELIQGDWKVWSVQTEKVTSQNAHLIPKTINGGLGSGLSSKPSIQINSNTLTLINGPGINGKKDFVLINNGHKGSGLYATSKSRVNEYLLLDVAQGLGLLSITIYSGDSKVTRYLYTITNYRGNPDAISLGRGRFAFSNIKASSADFKGSWRVESIAGIFSNSRRPNIKDLTYTYTNDISLIAPHVVPKGANGFEVDNGWFRFTKDGIPMKGIYRVEFENNFNSLSIQAGAVVIQIATNRSRKNSDGSVVSASLSYYSLHGLQYLSYVFKR